MPTHISWTDETWNPVTGCTKVSPGCAHCYIERTPPMRMSGRRFVDGKIPVQLHPDRLGIPLRWRKPRRVFVCSMGDLFHEDVPVDFIRWVFRVMEYSPQHTFQVLTKRPERALRDWKEYLVYPPLEGTTLRVKGDALAKLVAGEEVDWTVEYRWPPNVWLGVTAENQRMADERIPILLDTPAAVRFVSAEPLLGPLELEEWLKPVRNVDMTFVGHAFADPYIGRGFAEIPQEYCGICGNREPNPMHKAPPEPIETIIPGLDQLIAGGESGGPPERALVQKRWCIGVDFAGKGEECGRYRCKGHWHPKPEALEWVRSIRDQCQAAGVPFFLKQLGPRAGQGTLLDGREHKEMPR